MGLTRPAIACVVSVVVMTVPGPSSGAPGRVPDLRAAASRADGGVTPSDLVAFFGPDVTWRDRGSFGLDRTDLLPDVTAPGGKLLRVRYPAGSASPQASRTSGAPEGGAQAYLPLARPREVATLTYWVRFPSGFDFVKGGKLPGLYGGAGGSGGKHDSEGFSTRFMWRRGGDGEVYAYFPEGNGYGSSLGRGSWTFRPDRWMRIEQRVRLNNPGCADGSVEVRVDGREVFGRAGLTYRTGDRPLVDGVFFSSFFGGSDPSWASPRDQYVDFAAFSVG